MSPSPRRDASGVLVGMVPVPGRGWSTGGAEVADSRRATLATRLGTGPGRGWSTGSAEVADSRRRHWQPDWALDQDAVGVPAALRWQTAAGGIDSRLAENQDAVGVPAALRWQTVAGGIGSRKGREPGRGWSSGSAEVADSRRRHWLPKRRGPRSGKDRLRLSATSALQSSRNKTTQQSSCNKAAAANQPQQKHKRLTQTGQPLFHLPQPESSISPP